MCSGEVQRFEVGESNVASACLVALSDEIHDVLIGRGEGQVLGKHWLDVLSSDHLAVTLVKETEALLGLFVLARLRLDAFVPVIGHNMAHECEVDGVSLQDLGVGLLKLFFDVARAHSVEAKVLQNVTEQVVGNSVLPLLKVVVETLLEVGSHLRRKVANILAIGSLRDVLGLHLRARFLLGGHYLFQLQIIT